MGTLRNLARATLIRTYEKLTVNDAPAAADVIFVLAGRMERKGYGLELFRAAVAPRLVLSVGRFEVSKLSILSPEKLDELKALRDRAAPGERHFFITLDESGTHIEKSVLPRWSTFGEALAFRRFWEREKAPRVLVVSTDIHLRRVALTFAKVFGSAPVQFRYCPVPPSPGALQKWNWWAGREDRRFVAQELIKLVGYRSILLTPAWAIRRLMRLKN